MLFVSSNGTIVKSPFDRNDKCQITFGSYAAMLTNIIVDNDNIQRLTLEACADCWFGLL